jgi:Flp pilus assembly protein TadG
MNKFKGIKEEKGATAVITALMLVLLFGFTALAIDIGYLYAARNELQNAADASALAAARKLGSIYQDMTSAEQTGYICSVEDKAAIFATARDVAQKNTAAAESVNLNASDVIIGQWNEWKNLASGAAKPENLNRPDAVHVIARRDGSVTNGPINTFFARVLGVAMVNVSAAATAALTGQSTVDPGELELPVGISRVWFQGNFCGETVKFYPADSCAGWTGFNYNPNTPNMRQILDGNIENPTVTVGETEFEFTGGVAATLFDNLYDLFHRKAIWIDEGGNPTTEGNGTLVWSTTIVVYENSADTIVDGEPSCKNPNSSYPILGFARIDINEVLKTPEKSFKGDITCNFVNSEDSRSGGAYFGARGSIPGLVQ